MTLRDTIINHHHQNWDSCCMSDHEMIDWLFAQFREELMSDKVIERAAVAIALSSGLSRTTPWHRVAARDAMITAFDVVLGDEQ